MIKNKNYKNISNSKNSDFSYKQLKAKRLKKHIMLKLHKDKDNQTVYMYTNSDSIHKKDNKYFYSITLR